MAAFDRSYDSSSTVGGVDFDGKAQSFELGVISSPIAQWTGKIDVFFLRESGIPYPAPYGSRYIRGTTSVDDGLSFVFTHQRDPSGNQLLPSSTDLIAHLASHEVGHALRVPTAFGGEGHDAGLWPTGETSLIRSGNPEDNFGQFLVRPGLWLRHEDWQTANESVKALNQ